MGFIFHSLKLNNKKNNVPIQISDRQFGKFPGSPLVIPWQGAWVQSVVGELRSHIPPRKDPTSRTAKPKKDSLKSHSK